MNDYEYTIKNTPDYIFDVLCDYWRDNHQVEPPTVGEITYRPPEKSPFGDKNHNIVLGATVDFDGEPAHVQSVIQISLLQISPEKTRVRVIYKSFSHLPEVSEQIESVFDQLRDSLSTIFGLKKRQRDESSNYNTSEKVWEAHRLLTETDMLQKDIFALSTTCCPHTYTERCFEITGEQPYLKSSGRGRKQKSK